MKLSSYRRTAQIAFLAVTLLGLVGITTTGLIYPYFFCYSNPWDVAACPIGILEHSVIDMELVGLWTGLAMLGFLIGFLSLIGMIFGRAFCGWGCPVGALQDLTRKTGIGKKLDKKLGPKEFHPGVKYIKYVILAMIPVLSWWSLDLFYTTFCPVGGVTGTVPTLTFYFADWTYGTTFPLKITSIVLFVILIALVVRGWCKYLCPVGAYLAPWNKASVFRISRDTEACNNCGLCDRTCPMDVKDIGIQPDPECILCGRCVESCRKSSLTLGSRFAKGRFAGIMPWIIAVIIASGLMVAGAYSGGYERSDAINSIPCLGCLALDPVSPENWYFFDEDTNTHQQFVMDALDTGPVFLHYRTVVCAACDEMEPFIYELEEEYGNQIKFIHINLDLAPDDEKASYDDYDVLGTPDDTSGVPLFAIVTLNATEDGSVLVFKSVYGSSADGGRSKKVDLENVIQNATAMYQEVAGSIVITDSSKMPVVELFVDENCVNCPVTEEIMMDFEKQGISNFITYNTDADTISGNYSTYIETYYLRYYALDMQNNSMGHPWALYNGGPNNKLGAGSMAAYDSVAADYMTLISTAGFSPLNISIDGALGDSGGSLGIDFALANLEDSSQSYLVKASVVEKTSRFPNHEGDPIPNAFIDLAVNQTYDIAAGESEIFNITWNGTDAIPYSDFRLGNLAVVITVWQDSMLVNSKTIDAGIEETLMWEAAVKTAAVKPNGTAEFDLTLWNYGDSPAVMNFSVTDPGLLWTTNISAAGATIPALGSYDLAVTASNNNAALGTKVEIRVGAQDVVDPTIDLVQKLQLTVKDDIIPPTIASATAKPDEPLATDQLNISAVVGDLSPLKSVTMLYYSCTDEVCSATFEVNMTTTDGNTYVASAYPIEQEHNIFHYKITAIDEADNIRETDWLDVEIEPVHPPEHHADTGDATAINTYGIPILIIFAIAAIGLNAERYLARKEKSVRKEPAVDEQETSDSEEESQDN